MIDKLQLEWMRRHIPQSKPDMEKLAICLGDQQASAATGFDSAEKLFETFGCWGFYDVDYNGKAVVKHNLNTPIPPRWHQSAHIVYDGGTIEHVANIGEALRTMALCCEVGGYVIQESPVVPYGQAYYGIDPQVQRDFFRVNGFEMLQQTLHYRNSVRMSLLHAVVRWFPKRTADKIGAMVKQIRGAKEFIFADTDSIYVYPDNFADRHCYYVHPQTRSFYIGKKVKHVEPTQWPSMECYPEA